jgi:hypothetical protein
MVAVDLVGLPGFEPGSLTPEAKSLDQTSRQPLTDLHNFRFIIKLLAYIVELLGLISDNRFLYYPIRKFKDQFTHLECVFIIFTFSS